MKAQTLENSMGPSSEIRHGASASSTHFRFRRGSSGELSEEEDKTVTMATNRMMKEGNPLQFQQSNLETQHVTMQGTKEAECVAILVEQDAPQKQGAAAQSSCNHSGPMADSESGIMSYAVLIILSVVEVILGLDFFGVI